MKQLILPNQLFSINYLDKELDNSMNIHNIKKYNFLKKN